MAADPEQMVLDSGKLAALDRLLPKLKAEGHRVLIYCQMTRMIDITRTYAQIANMIQAQSDLHKSAIEKLADIPA